MSLSIYRIEMFQVTKLSSDDFEAINGNISQADDGTYYVDQDTLDELDDQDPKKINTISTELLQDLKDEHKKKGDFSFIIS